VRENKCKRSRVYSPAWENFKKKFTFGELDLFKGLKTVGETESW
jgi:hypothetical protein